MYGYNDDSKLLDFLQLLLLSGMNVMHDNGEIYLFHDGIFSPDISGKTLRIVIRKAMGDIRLLTHIKEHECKLKEKVILKDNRRLAKRLLHTATVRQIVKAHALTNSKEHLVKKDIK